MEKQITTTVRVSCSLNLAQWMLGFNVLDARKWPEDNMYGFVLVNFFFGPVRAGVMWEPLRQKQLDWDAEIARQAAELERDIKKLEDQSCNKTGTKIYATSTLT